MKIPWLLFRWFTTRRYRMSVYESGIDAAHRRATYAMCKCGGCEPQW